VRQDTSLAAWTDDTSLHIQVVCTESNLKGLKALHRTRDSAVWQDDCIEVFLDPGHTHREYWHIVVNPAGTVLDELAGPEGKDAGRNLEGLEVFSGLEAGAWTVSLRIPFKAPGIAPPRPGSCWAFNVTRSNSASPSDGFSTWSPLGSDSFHQPAWFGHLVFGEGEPVCALQKEAAGLLDPANAGRGLQRLPAVIHHREFDVDPGNGRVVAGRQSGSAWFLDRVAGSVTLDLGPTSTSLNAIALVGSAPPDGSAFRAARTRISAADLDLWTSNDGVEFAPAGPIPKVLRGGWKGQKTLILRGLETCSRFVKIRVVQPNDKADFFIATAADDVRAYGVSDKCQRQFPVAKGALRVPVAEPAREIENTAYVETSGAAVWTAGPNVKIRPGSVPRSHAVSRHVQLEAAAREYEAFQLCIRPGGVGLDRVSLEATALSGPAGAVIPASAVAWNPLGFVRVSLPSRGTGGSGDGVGYYPDPLCDPVEFTVPPNATRPVWVTVCVPSGTPPGLYRGAVKVQAANAALASFDLELKVWDFEIPPLRQSRLAGDAWNWCGKHEQHPGEAGLKDLYQVLVEHRISPRTILPLPGVRTDGGRVHVDFTEYDRMAGFVLDELGANCTGFPHVQGGNWIGIQESLRGRFLDRDISTTEGALVFQDYLRQGATHFRARGWLDRLVAQFWDEPARTGSVTGQLDRVCRLIRDADPGIRILVTDTVNRERNLFGSVDIWCGSYVKGLAEERTAAGDEIWTYQNDLYLVDFPALNARIPGWMAFAGNMRGVLFWSLTWWGDDPWREALSYMASRDTPLNGDGVLLYPPPDGGKGPLRPSLRFELLREGFEDYEYLWMLRELVSRAGAQGFRGEALQRARDVLEGDVEQVIRAGSNIPGYRNAGAFCVTPDAGVLERTRRRAAEAIVALRAALVSGVPVPAGPELPKR
jgi:hypothetical protein